MSPAPQSTEFSLCDLVIAVIEEIGTSDRDVLASEIEGRIPPESVTQALAQALPAFVSATRARQARAATMADATASISMRERLERRSDRDGECLLWRGATDTRGYGTITIGGRRGGTQLVHRVSYLEFIGPIPVGLEIDHVCHTLDPDCPGHNACRHKLCWNPDHLEAVTHVENMRRRRWRTSAA